MRDNKTVYGDNIMAPRTRSARKVKTNTWTTFKSGRLIPLKCIHTLAGDTLKLNLQFQLRELTPVVPVMDNSFINFGWFFVPNRITAVATVQDFSRTNDWETMFGETKSGFWANVSETTLRKIGVYGVEPQSPANYLGHPILKMKSNQQFYYETNLLEESAFVQIWNDHFRDPNLQAPIDLEFFGQIMAEDGINTKKYEEDLNFGSENGIDNFPVRKLTDYFTSATRSPQRGEAIAVDLGGIAPIVTTEDYNTTALNSYTLKLGDASTKQPINPGQDDAVLTIRGANGEVIASGNYDPVGAKIGNVIPLNLGANLGAVKPLKVSQIRYDFAVQGLLERSARCGNRYHQYLLAAFGTAPSDAVLQRAEYLGGSSAYINMQQVIQQSQDAKAPLGTTGAFSNTGGEGRTIIKTCTEPGVIMLCCWVRTDHVYSQGINCMKTKFRQFDFYDPMFANLGEQPIYNKEIYAKNEDKAKNDEVFGYKQAWEEYRTEPDTVSGELSPDSDDVILQRWTYADKYIAQPTLNSDWIVQDPSNIGKTLYEEDTKSQFFINVEIFGAKYSTVPSQSIPALLGGI